MRGRLTPAEKRLWTYLRDCQLGARFRRQVPIGHWIADFASFQPRMVIEVDDTSHDWRDETDRTAELERAGFVVIRVTNRDVAFHTDAVLDLIAATIRRLER